MKQKRYTPLTGGKAVLRDLTTYPETAQGEAALLAAVNNGALPIITAPPVAARAGVVPAPITETRVDSTGTMFTKSRPIALSPFVARLAPRPLGNYAALAPQQAQNTSLFKRLNDVTIHPSRTIMYAGPYYTDASDRQMLQKGYTHIAESTPMFGTLSPAGKKTKNLGGEIFIAAQIEAALLPDNDPRKGWLLMANATQQFIPDNEPACILIGKRLMSIIYQADQSINGCEWLTINIENAVENPNSPTPNNKELQQINALYYIYKAMINEAIALGLIIPKPLLYDVGNIAFLAMYFADNNENGFPAYMNPDRRNAIFRGGSPGSLMNENHPLATLMKTYGGSAGTVSYQRFTYDDQTMFQKDGNGNYLLDANGNPLWRTEYRRTTIFGQSTPISGDLAGNNNDALWMNIFEYMRMQLHVTDMYFLAGGTHLPTNQQQAGWDKLESQSWTRLDGEAVGPFNGSELGTQGEFNSRPRNPDELDWDAKMGYIFRRVTRCWMGPQPSIAMGASYVGADEGALNTAKGTWETFANGIAQAAELNFMLDTTWRLIQPRYFMRNQGIAGAADPNEHFARKPIVVGGLIPNYGGKPYIWLGWRYATQDVTDTRDMIVWAVGADGTTPITPGYRCTFEGRKGVLDYWQIPDAAAGIPPTQWRFQFTDLINQKRTWTGDYRDALITNHPTPPAVLEPFEQPTVTTPTTPTTPTAANGLSVPSTPTYNATTKKLKITLAGVVGTPKFTIVGVIGNADQPTDGFLITENAIGTTITIRVQTATQLIEFTQAIPAAGASQPVTGNDFPTAYSWDSNSKGYVIYALVGSGDYTALLTPLDGQTSPGATPRAMIVENNTVAGVTYNRSYLYLPSFAGGTADIAPQRWQQTVVSVADSSKTAVGTVTLVAGQNSAGQVTNGSATPAPTTPPAQPTTPPNTPPATVVNPASLPETMIALYSLDTHSRDYGNGPLDNSRYEQFGLSYVENSDGIKVPGLDQTKKYLPPYAKEFKELAVASSAPDKLGVYVTAKWSDFKIGANQSAVWATGGIAAGWKRYVDNLFNYFNAQGVTGALAVWPGRDNGYSEFLPVSEKGTDQQGRHSNSAVAVPAIRLFADLKPGFNVNAISTATSAGKYLSDLKLALNYMRPHQVAGTLGFIMVGTHTNGEQGFDTRQDSPPDSWTDWAPEALAKLRTYLQTIYANIGALNSAWGTGYGNWDQVTYPYSGDFGDFRGQRGLDCQKFRHIQLGDTLEVMARVVWSELPGLLIMVQFGQPFGGQGAILSTLDTGYLIKRVQDVATEKGYTHLCVGMKYNPTPEDNHQVRGNYARYQCNKHTGGCLVMHEDSYELASNPALLGAITVSDNMADATYGARTGRAGDGAASCAVLFSPTRWAGVDTNGNPSDAGNSVKAMFQRLWTLPRRRQAAAGIGTTDPNKKITITMPMMLAGQPPADYPWFAQATNDWLAKGGQTSDVKFDVIGFF